MDVVAVGVRCAGLRIAEAEPRARGVEAVGLGVCGGRWRAAAAVDGAAVLLCLLGGVAAQSQVGETGGLCTETSGWLPVVLRLGRGPLQSVGLVGGGLGVRPAGAVVALERGELILEVVAVQPEQVRARRRRVGVAA